MHGKSQGCLKQGPTYPFSLTIEANCEKPNVELAFDTLCAEKAKWIVSPVNRYP